MTVRAIVFGSSGIGTAAFEGLRRAGVEVPLVFCAADEPGVADDLAAAAAAAGTRFHVNVDVEKKAQFSDEITDAQADLIVVAGYDRNVSTHIAKLAPNGIYVHASLLPAYRGPSPLNWAIINGDRATGVSILKLARANDAGEILLQTKLEIAEGDDAGSLQARASSALAELLAEYVARLRANDLPAGTAQDTSKATMYPRVAKRDGHVRFDQGSKKIVDRVRGVTPSPGAYTDFCGVEFPIAEISIERLSGYDDEPGRVLAVDDREKVLRVKSLDGVLRVKVIDELNRLGAIAQRNADLLQFAGKITPFSSANIADGAVYDTEMPTDEELTKYLEFPDMIVVAVAYPCNAHCPNCPYVEENSDIRKKYADANFISPELYMKISDECGEAARKGWLPGGVGSMIRITGGGEPMMHPYGMTKLIEYSKSVGARVYLNTNGSLFKQDDIDRLLACNVDNIEVSVDAADPQTYAVVRQGLNWDHVLASLRYMIDRRNATRSQTTIEVSVINQEIVSGTIDQIEKFWYDFGVDNVIVRKFLTWGSSTNIDPNTSADPMAYLDRDSGVPCPYPFHRLNVDSRGKVEVCGFDIMGRTNMGSLKEQSIREIWRGAMFEWWRKKHRDGQGGDIPLCAECPDWKYRSWEHNYRKALKNAQLRRDEAFAKP